MADGRHQGKGVLVQRLMDREGYTREKANKVVNAFIDVLKKNLAAGKNVELEGIGTLRLIPLNTKRRIEKNLIGNGGKPTIVTAAKHKKTIRLKATLKLENLQ